MKVAQASACVRVSLYATVAFLLLPIFASAQSQSQQPAWFTTGTNMGVNKSRIAVADFAGANPSSNRSANNSPKSFAPISTISGIIDLVSPSMYPLQVPSQPIELQAASMV